MFYFCFLVLCFNIYILGLALNLHNACVLAIIYSVQKIEGYREEHDKSVNHAVDMLSFHLRNVL